MSTMQRQPRPTFGTVPEPFTKGMAMLEQAMHQLDKEAKNLEEWPDEILRRAAQIETCYLVLHDAILRHLPPRLRLQYQRPPRQFQVSVEDGLQEIRAAHDG